MLLLQLLVQRHEVLEAEILVQCAPADAVAVGLVVLQCFGRSLPQTGIVSDALTQFLPAVGQYVYIVAPQKALTI